MGSPIGPGFFIFFQKDDRKTQLDPLPYAQVIERDRTKQDDEELLLIIQLATTYKLI